MNSLSQTEPAIPSFRQQCGPIQSRNQRGKLSKDLHHNQNKTFYHRFSKASTKMKKELSN
jgi:hypothetical protein